ncbi:unnamed protein product, partial [Closterium sp. NIES-64]
TSASPLSPSPLPHLPLQGASPTSPLSRYLHAASSSPLPSRLQGPSHPALAPARRHSLLSQYPVSPHLFLSRLKNKVRPPRPYPGSSPFPPPSLPRVSPPLPLFSFSFSLHIAAMRALGGTKHVGSCQSMWGHIKACGVISPYPAIPPPPCPPTPPSPSASPPASPYVSPSSPPRQPPIRSWTRSQASPVRGGGSQRAGSWTVPTASQSPRSGERRGSLAPAPPAPVNPRTSSSPSPPLTPLPVRSQLDALPSFPCPRGWFTARGLTDGRHRFTVNPSLSSPPCRPPPLTAGRPPQLPLSPGVLDALPSFPCPRGWFTAAGLTDGPNRFTVTALRGAPGVTGTRLQAATADVGMGGEWGGGVEGGGGGGGGGRGGAQVEAQAQATYEWVADAASPVPTLTVDPPQAREGSVQISIAFDKPCLGLQCNSTETSPSEMHFSAPSFPFPLASNPVVPIPSKAASPVPTLTVDPPQAREGSAQISIAFDKPCPGLQCNSTEISPSEMHFSAPSFPFPLASNHVVPIKSGQSGANANSGPATGKGGVGANQHRLQQAMPGPAAREGSVQISIAFDKPCPGLQCNSSACGAGITTGQSQVQASPQGIVSIDPSSFLACADSSGRAWMAGFGSYAVIRIDRAPLEATLACDTPLAVVKFFTQLRATPRVSQSPVTCRVLFSKPVSSFPSSSLAIANATASNPQSVSDLEYQFQPVSSFSSASLAVANATTSDPQHVTDLEYQFQVWPTGKGSVVVDIRHENVTDVAGNICQPTQPFFFFFFFDTTPPTVQLSGSETSATTDWVYPILVAFSPSLLPLYHAALSPHFSLSRFRFATMSALQPPDTTRPTVQLSASESSATTNWVYPILVAFSEPVLGFNSSSLQLSNGVITCWTGVDRGLGRYYEVTVAAVSNGHVTCTRRTRRRGQHSGVDGDSSGGVDSSLTIKVSNPTTSSCSPLFPILPPVPPSFLALSAPFSPLFPSLSPLPLSLDPCRRPGRCGDHSSVGGDGCRGLDRTLHSSRLPPLQSPSKSPTPPPPHAAPASPSSPVPFSPRFFPLSHPRFPPSCPVFSLSLSLSLSCTRRPRRCGHDSSVGGYGSGGVDSMPLARPWWGLIPPRTFWSIRRMALHLQVFALTQNLAARRMALHLQVFALTQNLAVRVLPLFYRQLTGGLRWTYFYLPTPFRGSFDGWKGVHTSPTDTPGQDNSTAPPSCAQHYLATKTDSSAASCSLNPSQPSVPTSNPLFFPSPSLPSLPPGTISPPGQTALPPPPPPSSPLTPHNTGSLPGQRVPLKPASLPSSLPSTLHSAFPSHTLLPSSLSSHPPTHYHRMLQETTANTTINSTASGHRGFNATALIGGGAGGDAAAVAAAKGFDPTQLPRLSEEKYEYMQAWGDAYYSHFPNLFYSYHGFEQFCTVLFRFALFFSSFSLLQLLIHFSFLSPHPSPPPLPPSSPPTLPALSSSARCSSGSPSSSLPSPSCTSSSSAPGTTAATTASPASSTRRTSNPSSSHSPWPASPGAARCSSEAAWRREERRPGWPWGSSC